MEAPASEVMPTGSERIVKYDDLRQRLITRFAAIFPDLSKEEISRASQRSVGSWDSLATVTLIAVLEKEFGIRVPSDDLDQLVSFELILAYLQRQASARVA